MASARRMKSLMQNEVFVILVAVLLLSFVTYARALHRKNERLQQQIEEWEPCPTCLVKPELPPLIQLNQADGYTFEKSSAALTEEFEQKLRELLGEIDRLAAQAQCDVIEVYGFTDGQPHAPDVADPEARFDRSLLSALERRTVPDVRSASNAELGLLRAVAVTSFLLEEKHVRKRLSHISHIRPYSGGSITLPDGRQARAADTGDDPIRRRIELRLSRSRDLHGKVAKKLEKTQ